MPEYPRPDPSPDHPATQPLPPNPFTPPRFAAPAAPNPLSDLQHICLTIMAVCAALILGIGLPALALGLLARLLGLR